MSDSSELISATREFVLKSYDSAKADNYLRFRKGDVTATREYIFSNQIEDANSIVNKFYKNNRRVISIQKKTKIGADGLMIEICKILTTHIDDKFIVDPDNIRIITGMSNVKWEKDMKDKAPSCFKDKIFHHGKLSKADLSIKNGLIIIDEIDSGDGECKVLHRKLKEAGILDVKHMEQYNNRFIFISATMIKELYDLYTWGELHELHIMIIPDNYIGHKDFLDRGIVKEYYPLNTKKDVEKWIKEDILKNYGNEYRVHFVRINGKNVDIVQNTCILNDIEFRSHTSSGRLSPDEIKDFFEKPLTKHIVLGVKGFYRRATLIPNQYKLRIGAVHELYTKKPDNNVQIQGLIGRLTGYWRVDIDTGHKTGPYRTSIKAIEEYEKIYLDPFGINSYQSYKFKKDNGEVVAASTMLSAKNIKNLSAINLPKVTTGEFERGYRVFDTQIENEKYAKTIGAKISAKYVTNADGFKICSAMSVGVHSLEEILKIATTSKKGSNMDKKLRDLKVNEYAHRRYVCYKDITDIKTECFVTIWVKRLKNLQ